MWRCGRAVLSIWPHSRPKTPLTRPSSTTASTACSTAHSAQKLHILRAFLDSKSTPKPPHTIEQIIDLYSVANSNGQLQKLSSSKLSSLVSLFGTISWHKFKPPAAYGTPLVSRLVNAGNGAYWTFVHRVLDDKEAMERTLSDSDRYWRMTAYISNFDAWKAPPLDLEKAKAEYLKIWSHSSDPDLHLPFLASCLSLNNLDYFHFALIRVCKLMEEFGNPHSRLLELLWSLATDPQADRYKDRIMTMITARLVTLRERVVRSERLNVAEHSAKRVISVSSLTAAMTGTLFPYHYPDVPRQVQDWATKQMVAVFSAPASLGQRWDAFQMLASLHNSGRVIPTRSQDLTEHAVQFQVILNLDSLIKETCNHSPWHIQYVTRRLWLSWYRTSCDLIVHRAVLAAFFRMTMQGMDRRLLDECHAFCIEKRLFEGTAGDDDELQIKALLLDSLVATLHVNGLPGIHDALSKMPSNLANRAAQTLLEHLINTDVRVALRVYRYSVAKGMSLSDSLPPVLATALLGTFPPLGAVDFLRKDEMAPRHVEKLLRAFLRDRNHVRNRMVAISLADTYTRVYAETQPPSQLRHSVQHLILALACMNHVGLELFWHVHTHSSEFLTRTYVLRLLRLLLSRRRFQLAVELAPVTRNWKEAARDNFYRKLIMGLIRGRAYRLAHYAKKYHQLGRPSQTVPIATHVRFTTRRPERDSTIRDMLTGSRKIDLPSIKYAFSALLTSKRPLLALKLLKAHHQALPPKVLTRLGNTLLFSGPRYKRRMRNGRLLKQVLELRTILLRRFAFVEDRVTLNIIVRASLRWRATMDVDSMKQLFDALVTSGYPTSPSHHVPFRTSPFQRKMLPELIDILARLRDASSMSFPRHIRPLYMLFIQEFRLRGDYHAAQLVSGVLSHAKRQWTQRMSGTPIEFQ